MLSQKELDIINKLREYSSASDFVRASKTNKKLKVAIDRYFPHLLEIAYKEQNALKLKEIIISRVKAYPNKSCWIKSSLDTYLKAIELNIVDECCLHMKNSPVNIKEWYEKL
jgi:hypothetical protein